MVKKLYSDSIKFYFRNPEQQTFVSQRRSKDSGVDEDHPNHEKDVKNHSDMKEYVEEFGVTVFIIVFIFFCHDRLIHYQGCQTFCEV